MRVSQGYRLCLTDRDTECAGGGTDRTAESGPEAEWKESHFPHEVKSMKFQTDPLPRIRQITRRNRGISLAKVIVELNLFLVGWLPATASRRVNLNSNAWTAGCAANCAAIAANNARGASRSLGFSSGSALHGPCASCDLFGEGLVAFIRDPLRASASETACATGLSSARQPEIP
jgi:hypothetical protein